MKSSIGTDVAFEDLTLLQDMITYKNFAQTIAKRAFKKIANLECFLSEETVVFALFSDNSELTNKKKKKKVRKKHLATGLDNFRRGIRVVRAITIDHATELHDMIRPEKLLFDQNRYYSQTSVFERFGSRPNRFSNNKFEFRLRT